MKAKGNQKMNFEETKKPSQKNKTSSTNMTYKTSEMILS